MTAPVVVVGAGPTGLMLAAELGLAGVRCVVLERSAAVEPHAFGMGIHARAVDAFRERGLDKRLGLDEAIVWPRIHFAQFWLNLSELNETEYTLVMPQWRTEQMLAARAEELGADIRRGHELRAIEQDGDGVTVTVHTADGEYRLRAGYLVGCDGGGSLVRELAEIHAPQHGPSYYGVLGDVRPAPGTQLDFSSGLKPTGLYGALPLGPDTFRLMAIEFDPAVTPPDGPVTEDELGAAVERMTGRRPELGEITWLARYSGWTRLAENYRAGRVFLAGDAAHEHFFAATHGLSTGIHDALNLGWKLAAQVNGWAPDGLLDSYHAERHPVGARACLNSRAQTALTYPLDEVGPLRELFGEIVGFESVNRFVMQMITTVRYPFESASPAHPLLGGRLPHVELDAEGGPLATADTLRGGRGVLFHFGTEPLPWLEEWPGRVDVVTAKQHSTMDAEAVLVRPDGHVAYAGDVADLRPALAAWFGEPVPVSVA